MVKDIVVSVLACLALGWVVWVMLKPRDPRWLRDVTKREKALKEVLPTIIEEQPLMAAVPYRDLVEHQFREVADFVHGHDGSLLVINVYDGDEPAMSGRALESLKARIGRFAEMAHTAVSFDVKRRGYASGLLLEVRLLRS